MKDIDDNLTEPLSDVSNTVKGKYDGNGKYVMVIKDGIAEQRYVEIGENIKDRFVIKSGLTTDDKIAITGAQKLSNGQKVKATEALD